MAAKPGAETGRNTDDEGQVLGTDNAALCKSHCFALIEFWRFAHNAEDCDAVRACLQIMIDQSVSAEIVHTAVRQEWSGRDRKDALGGGCEHSQSPKFQNFSVKVA